MREEWTDKKTMAALRDLQQRAGVLDAALTYKTKIPTWLAQAADTAAAGRPVIVNVKGIAADKTPVIVTLAELERLHAAAVATEGE